MAESRVIPRVQRLLILVVLGAMAALDRIDVAPRSAHPPGITGKDMVAGGFGDIATPARLQSLDTGVRIARGWLEFERSYESNRVSELIRWYAAVDLTLIVMLACLVSTAILAMRHGDTSLSTAAWCFLALYVMADLAETFGLALAWEGISAGGVRFVAAASGLKWACLAIVGVLVALGHIGAARDAWRSFVRDFNAVRGPILVSLPVALLMVGLAGDLGRQMDDVIVRAGEDGWPAIWATLFALLAWFLLTAATDICRVAARCPPKRLAHDQRLRWARWVGVPSGVAGLTLLGLGTSEWVGDHRGWVSSAGVALVLVAALLVPDLFRAVRCGEALLSDETHKKLFVDAPAGGQACADGEPHDDDTPPDTQGSALMSAVRSAPVLALFVAVTRAATTTDTSQLLVHGPGGGAARHLWLWAGLLGVMWVACGPVARYVLPLALPPGQALALTRWVAKRALTVWGLAAGLLVLVLPWIDPLSYGQPLGTPAILMLAIITWTCVATALTLVGDKLHVGGVLARLGMRRTPLFALLAVWSTVAALADPVGAYYRVRPGDWSGDNTTPRIGDVFHAWESQHGRPALLVFVAAPGGGIRAAYWTRLGMDCAFGTACGGADITDRVFLASGVSGGAVGLAGVRARQFVADPPDTTGHAPRLAEVLEDDFLAPSLAAFFFRDVPNSYLRLPVQGFNRADTLESAWEHDQPGLGRSFAGMGGYLPKLVLNATSVEDGCRLAMADVDLRRGDGGSSAPGIPHKRGFDITNCAGGITGEQDWPGAFPVRDARQWIPTPLRLSTSALNAARFPYVSPAGMLDGHATRPPTYALDGGLVDNSGASALLQAVHVLKADGRFTTSSGCVSPRLVVFDSSQTTSGNIEGTDRPLQSLAPLATALGGFHRNETTPLARLADEIASLAAACGEPDRNKAVVVIAPKEQPASGLPLGWTLSNLSRQQMDTMMRGNHQDVSVKMDSESCKKDPSNWCALQTVRSWVEAPPTP